MVTTDQQIPNPMPHELVGEIGHQLWVWTARFAPTWLKGQTDPEALFTDVNDKLLQMNENQVRLLLKSKLNNSDSHQISDENLTRILTDLHMPPAEVTQPVWDGHSDGFNPDEPPDFPLG